MYPLQQLVDLVCQFFKRRQPCSDGLVLIGSSVDALLVHHGKYEVERDVLNGGWELRLFTHGSEPLHQES